MYHCIVIDVIVACGVHFVRCCQSYDCSVCACVRVCMRACMCTGSDGKHVFMRLGFICLVLYWCHLCYHCIPFSTGADPEAKSHTGLTPLMVACDNDHRQVANLLLEHGEQPQYCSVWQLLVY